MNKILFLSAAAALALTASSASAEPAFALQPQLHLVQFVSSYQWGGRDYCWYSNGWQGEGFYWCG